MVFVCCKAIQPHVVLGACYRPPDSDSTFIPMFHDALQSLKIHFPNAPVVLFGDFNFPNIDWSDLVLVTSKQNIESNFVDTCLTFALTQIVNAATRQSKHSANILDLVLTTHPDRITSLSYLDEISDHKVIHGTFQCRLKRPDKTRKKLTLYDKGDYNNFNKELTKFCQFVVKDFNKRSVTENWLMFKSKMHELISTYIPTITIGERSTSRWFNPELKRLKNKKKRQFRAAKNSNNPVAWQKYQTTTKLFCSAIDKAKRLFNNTTLPNLLRTNPKQFWRVINPRNENKCISIMDPTGQPIANNAVAEELNHTFSSVFTREPIENLPDVSPHNYPTMPDVIFSPQGIQKIIESLKLTSSCGIDGINAKVLKNTKEITSVILSYIFQQSLSSGIVPHDWKVGKIVPVPKPGSSSYRPISLTSVCSKIMEHIIHSQIANFLTSVKFFHPNQHGFQRGLSCDTQLALFIHDLSASVDLNIPVDALFIDFEKAFDKVPHNRLLLKLSQLSLNQLVYNWIQDFLTNRQQFVEANDTPSSLSNVISGVPQGTVLGPLLFLIYINDLPDNISSNIRLFADDCVIYRPITNVSDTITLQQDLLKLDEWCRKWLMVLNTNKTALISFHRRQNLPTTNYNINGSIVSSLSSIKYLGVNISQNLNWSFHVSKIVNNANRALGYLRRNLHLAPPSVKLLAYKTLIRPKLEYASAIWDPFQINLSKSIELIQNRAVRFIYSDYSYHTSVTTLKRIADLPNLDLRRKVSRLSLYHKMYHTFHYNCPIQSAHRTSARTSHHKAVYPPPACTTAHHHSFFAQAARDWNDLPPSVIHHSNTDRFKNAIESLFY